MLERAASVRLFRYGLGQLTDSSVADRRYRNDDVAGAFLLLQRNCRARVRKVEVLIVTVEIVVGRQRLVSNFHLRTRTAPTFESSPELSN